MAKTAQKSLKEFNPDTIARLETLMWQRYYNHQFFRLFLLLVQLMKEFQLSYLQGLRAAYYAVSAAIDFRTHRGKENEERITKKLEQFFTILSIHIKETFDHKKAARLELEWWLIDRYSQDQHVRREALRNAIAVVCNIDPIKLNRYADCRAQAMELQDEAEKQKKNADWEKVFILLQESFRSLHNAIQ